MCSRSCSPVQLRNDHGHDDDDYYDYDDDVKDDDDDECKIKIRQAYENKRCSSKACSERYGKPAIQCMLRPGFFLNLIVIECLFSFL